MYNNILNEYLLFHIFVYKFDMQKRFIDAYLIKQRNKSKNKLKKY